MYVHYGGDGWDGWMMCNRSILCHCIRLSLASPPLSALQVVSGRCRHDMPIHRRPTEYPTAHPVGMRATGIQEKGTTQAQGAADMTATSSMKQQRQLLVTCPIRLAVHTHVGMYVDFSGMMVRHPDFRFSQRYGTLRTILLDSSGIEDD